MKKKLLYIFILFIFFNACFNIRAQTKEVPALPTKISVAYWEVTDPNDIAYYYIQILKLALDKTRNVYGDYSLIFSDEHYSDDRKLHMVKNNNGADLLWASVTAKRQKQMQVIPVNLLRDYNNYRLLLILAKNKTAFTDINNLEDLKLLRAGGGLNWTDSKILTANGVKVATTVKFNYLIKMLLADRVDYISRGMHEVYNDKNMFSYLNSDLMVEENILLRYKYPIMYSFFVHKNNDFLATRIKRGLALAEADGSFLKVFKSISAFQVGLESLTDKRVHIELDNSLLFKQSIQ